MRTITNVRLSRIAATLAVSGCLMTGLVACSGKDDPVTPEPTPAPSQTGVISPPKLTTVPELKKPKGIVADATMPECTQGKGPVKANGTIKNSADSKQDLVVVVSWVVPQGSDVVARGVAVIKDAKAGSSHDWSVAADVAVDQQTQCVLSARRGSL